MSMPLRRRRQWQQASALDRDVLVGRGVGKPGDPAKPGFSDPRPDAIEKAELPDRGVNGPLVDELLHLVQRSLAPLEVELGCLLLKQRIEVGIAAISVGTALDHKGFEAR